ncbi:MAG: hypothetical protein V2I57_02885 [Xanthomonadales bacterium]|nr:hypothetical protein [Xanthomonadales bacterium]
MAGALWMCPQAQATEASEPPLLITGGWLFDGVSDARRPNAGILVQDGVITAVDLADGARALGVVHDPESLLKAAEGQIGPSGPDDHENWVLKVPPLRP